MGGSRSHSKKKKLENRPLLVLTFSHSIPCVFCLYTLLKVVSHYDLSVLSMSVDGVGGWMSFIHFLFGFFAILLTLQSTPQ